MLVPVVLAGGLGTRLWPLSREAYPKQFVPLWEGKSLFQETLARITLLTHATKPIVLGNEAHRFLLAEQMYRIGASGDVLLEPEGKGTAPACALAAMHALDRYDKDVLLLVLPADHWIADNRGFLSTVQIGESLAWEGKLVTFGVVPLYPETGYGYIQKGEAIGPSAFEILQFVEKPHYTLAERYCDSKSYWWNSGIFLFSASTYLQELMLLEEPLFTAAKAAYRQGDFSADCIKPNAEAYAQSPVNSIDYAVMEKTTYGCVVPLESAWSDIGAWDALAKVFPTDEEGNVTQTLSQSQVVLHESSHCFVRAQHRLVVGVGLKDTIVIETPDVVLVLDKRYAQTMRSVVQQLKTSHHQEVVSHSLVHRPWGTFESIVRGEGFQVKQITVAVNGKLSLQRHYHRSEHWVVVKGTACVTRGQETFLLSENQSTYIPVGVDHRLENVGKIPLEIIEVQSGTYLGEDDILRLEDVYGRDESVVEVRLLEKA